MPTVQINVCREGFKDLKAAGDAIITLQEYLSWILKKLDSGNIVRITTNQTLVTSKDGNTILDGTQIIMKDAVGTTRAVLGLEPDGDFKFTLNNEAGEGAVYINDDGNAVFSGEVTASAISGSTITGTDIDGSNITGATITGTEITSDTTIDVTTDLMVGDNIYLGLGNSSDGDTKNIQFFDGVGTQVAQIETKMNGDIADLTIKAAKITLSTMSGVYDWLGNTYLTGNGVNGSFTVGTSTFTIENGLITDIT